MWMSSSTLVKVVYGAVYTVAVSCFLRQFVVWLCMRPVRSIVYCGAGSNSDCAWYAQIRLIYKPSSVFVQYAYREYRIHLFSLPVVAVFCCETNREPLFCGLFAQVTRRPARVSASKCGLVASHGQGRADVEVVQ